MKDERAGEIFGGIDMVTCRGQTSLTKATNAQ